MTRKVLGLLTMTILLVCFTALGWAQQKSDDQGEEARQKQSLENQQYDRERFPAGLLGMGLDDKVVRSTDGDRVGDVEDVIVSEDGETIHLIIGHGGFLGMGQEEVVVPYDHIQNTNQNYVIFKGTAQDLEGFATADPRYRYGRRPGYGRFYDRRPGGWAADPYNWGPGYRGAYRAGYGPGYRRPMGMMPPAEREQMRRDMEEAQQKYQERETEYWAKREKEGDAYAKMRTGEICTDRSAQAGELIGSTVKNRQGQSVGDVNELIVGGQQGPYAIIGVGGFLGLGEHTIAVPLYAMEYAKDGALIYDATKEELKQHPAFDPDEAAACGAMRTAAGKERKKSNN